MTLPIIEVGRSYRVNFGPGNINNHTLHVRAVVDGDQYVCRRWSRRKGWMYVVEDISWLELMREKGQLKPTRSAATTDHIVDSDKKVIERKEYLGTVGFNALLFALGARQGHSCMQFEFEEAIWTWDGSTGHDELGQYVLIARRA